MKGDSDDGETCGDEGRTCGDGGRTCGDGAGRVVMGRGVWWLSRESYLRGTSGKLESISYPPILPLPRLRVPPGQPPASNIRSLCPLLVITVSRYFPGGVVGDASVCGCGRGSPKIMGY